VPGDDAWRKSPLRIDTHTFVHQELSIGRRRFLSGLSATDGESATVVLQACSTISLAAAAPRFATSFRDGTLLLVDDGFVVTKATARDGARPIVTCEAAPGDVILPPSPEEVLSAPTSASLTLLEATARSELIKVPGLAERLVDALGAALRERQHATANFGPTHHVERVRQKLLQLAQNYGHVVRDGIRIDFPVSHALLAEMVGSSRETVTRAVDELQRDGFVERRGSTYRLLM
jgi:hypothetical protein